MEEANKLIMGIVGVAVILVVGLIVLGQVKTSVGSSISATTVTNEEIVYVNNTLKDFATPNGFELTCSSVKNATTTGATIGASYYTCATNGITIVSDSFGGNGTAFVTYTYKIGDSAYNSTGANITKLVTIPTWIGILITVALAFLVLGYFMSRR